MLTSIPSERMVLPLWRSLHSLNLMLPKEDRKAMLLRLYNEDTPLMDHSKERFHKDSKDQPSAGIKDGSSVIKDAEAVDADVKDEMIANGEGEEGNVGAEGLGKELEMEENGFGDEEMEDDVLSEALKEGAEDRA